MNKRSGARVQLGELLEDVDVRTFYGDARVEVTALTHDSRRVDKGACFACIPGATADGHTFAPAAVAAGAAALLVERRLDLGVPEAEVDSVRRALGPAASRFHGSPSHSMRCLGVTGTNGKTTTTYLLEQVANAAGERAGLVGTTGARIDGEPIVLEHTTPEATELQALLAQMRDRGVRTVAMEVSSHALEQHRVDGTWFAAVGFTNLTHDHLDYHGSLEAYFDAKARLFHPARAQAGAVNLDDAHGRDLIERATSDGLPVVTFSIEDEAADVGAEDVRIEPDGSRFAIRDRRSNDFGEVTLSLVGRFNLSNALAAAATALAGGLDLPAIVRGLSGPLAVPGRFERVDAGQPFTVLVDYAHTPDALSTVLEEARSLAAGNQVIVVFGCGGDRDREKRPLMGMAAGNNADLAIVTSDNPRTEEPEAIAEQVVGGMHDVPAEVLVEIDRRDAIALALDRARAGDVVVVAGKGHETGQTIGTTTRPFDDRAVAREELGALAWS
jgi:UDP-N-acetylmuramoyl-L-alanyl-D-glutamate--2,6-diaminopimelate ligase